MSEVNRRRFLQLASTGVILGTCPPSIRANTHFTQYTGAVEKSRQSILDALEKTGTPSATVALVGRNGLIWSEAFGFTDKSARQHASTETLYCIGSCSKVIAATAVMMLVDRKTLELDIPIVKYLRDFSMASADYDKVTVRMLLNHSSGFPGSNYRNAFTASPHHEYLMETVGTLRDLRLKHPPGEYSVYCNDGFTLAELLISRVTGTPYTEFVMREILKPLGMAASRFAVAPFPEGSYAPAYRGDTRQAMEFVNPYGSGGLYSSATDMQFLLRLFLNGGMHNGHRILSSASIAEMGSNQTLRNSFRPVTMRDGYGLGWDGVMHEDFAASDITAWHKSGGTSVYSSFMIVLPEEGLAVFTSGAALAYNASHIAGYVLSEAILENGRVKERAPSQARVGTASTSPQLADKLQGVYAYYAGVMRIEKTQAGELQSVELENGGWSGARARLRQNTDGSFVDVTAPETSFRLLAAAGHEYLIARTPPGIGPAAIDVPFFQKMQPGRELRPAWMRRLGKRWVLVNESAHSLVYDFTTPVLRLSAIPGLPGYVVVNAPSSGTNNQLVDASRSNDIASMCLRIPFNNGRDLNDLRVIPSPEGDWLKLGSYLFQPESTIPVLTNGMASLSVKSRDQGSWLRLDTATGSALKLTGATDWKLFDSKFTIVRSSNKADANDSLDIGREQRFLLVYGEPGAIINVAF